MSWTPCLGGEVYVSGIGELVSGCAGRDGEWRRRTLITQHATMWSAKHLVPGAGLRIETRVFGQGQRWVWAKGILIDGERPFAGGTGQGGD